MRPAASAGPGNASAETAARFQPKSLRQVEEALGGNLLNKLGMVVLVFGVALFLTYQWHRLGPAGKVALGYSVGAVILGAGILLERRERYRIIARAGIGGGWALLFFTTYATYHVDAARIIASQVTCLVMMLAVAAAMVLHTLRYRSQVVTGLAFLLGFSTITLSHVNAYSLVAGAILAIGVVSVTLRFQWLELEIFGLLAGYLNHFFWLYSVLEPLGGNRRAFKEFVPSAALLLFYWAVFRAAYLLRRPLGKDAEDRATVSAIVNSFLVLGLLKYQSTRPELAFYLLIGMGCAELALAWTSRARSRRTPFLILSTIGAVLLVAAIPFRYSHAPLTVLWLFEAEAFLLAGVFTREVVFRRLGMLAALLTGLYALVWNWFEILDALGKHGGRNDLPATLLFGVIATALYLDALWIRRRWAPLFDARFDRSVMYAASYLAALLAAVAACMVWPGAWVAVALMVLALGLVWDGRRMQIRDWCIQGTAIAALSLLRALVFNLGETAAYGRLHARLITTVLVGAGLYACSKAVDQRAFRGAQRLPDLYTWAGSGLLALLALYELKPMNVGLAWAVLGLALFELGVRRSALALRFQAYAAFAITFIRLLAVNLPMGGVTGHYNQRVYTVLPFVGACLYVLWRLRRTAGQDEFALDRQIFAAQYHSYLAALVLALLAWYDLQSATVALAWALLGVLFFEAGANYSQLHLRLQGYALLAAGFMRIFFVNLNAQAAEGELSARVYTTLPLAAAFFYGYWRTRESVEQLPRNHSFRPSALLCWFGTLTIAAVMRFELDVDWVVAAWALLALLLVAVAMVAERTFLYQALALAIAIFGRGWMHNLYERAYLPAPFWQRPLLVMAVTTGLLFMAVVFARRVRSGTGEGGALARNGPSVAADEPFLAARASDGTGAPGRIRRALRALAGNPHQVFFFVALVLLTLALRGQMRGGVVTLAWGIEAVCVFLFALWLGERAFRLSGLALLLLCVAKIFIVDAWALEPTDRYLTFIVLGSALLFVSFLYARYRELLARYL